MALAVNIMLELGLSNEICTSPVTAKEDKGKAVLVFSLHSSNRHYTRYVLLTRQRVLVLKMSVSWQ